MTTSSNSDVLDRLALEPNGYFLVTLHRAENVDVATRLNAFMEALVAIESASPASGHRHRPIHAPRTACGCSTSAADRRRSVPGAHSAFSISLNWKSHARCVLSDSGTVQEECAIFGVPDVTLRDVTERPETLERGSNILTGADPEQILACVETVLALPPHGTAARIHGTQRQRHGRPLGGRLPPESWAWPDA